MWLGHIYYTLGLIVILSVVFMLIKLNTYLLAKEWYLKFEKVTGKKPAKSDFRSQDELTVFYGISSLSVVEFIWIVAGLLTSSWYVYLSLLVYSFIMGYINKSTSLLFVKRITIGHFLIIKIFVYLYLVVNHFHLHYDTLQIIKDLF